MAAGGGVDYAGFAVAEDAAAFDETAAGPAAAQAVAAVKVVVVVAALVVDDGGHAGLADQLAHFSLVQGLQPAQLIRWKNLALATC